MNGYFHHVQKPSDEDRQALELEWRTVNGSARWHSHRVERLWLNHVIREQGGIKCPDATCTAMFLPPSADYVGPVHCPATTCRFHVHPFCSRCFRTAHDNWAVCNDIVGIEE